MDPREPLLSRLFVVLSGIEGVDVALRNQLIAETDHGRTYVVLLDGDENEEPNLAQRRESRAPRIMVAEPEIYVAIQRPAEQIGPALNALRARIIRAVCTDGDLLTLCGPNGYVQYAGCASSLALGRSMQGEAGLSFLLGYPLRPDQL